MRVRSLFTFATAMCSLVASDCTAQMEQGCIKFQESSSSGLGANMDLIHTPDGGYMLAGIRGSSSPSAFVAKLDDNGAFQWQKFYGAGSTDVFAAAVQTADGGYAVAGSTFSFGTGLTDLLITKLDDAGNVQWAKAIGTASAQEYALGLTGTTDGGFVAVGALVPSGVVEKCFVVRVDAAGAMVWAREVATFAAGLIGESVVQAPDGGFVVGGRMMNLNNPACVLKLDPAGGVEWCMVSQQGVQSGVFLDVRNASDGGYLLAGRMSGVPGTLGEVDMCVLQIDSLGNLLWDVTLSGPLGESASDVVETADGGVVVGGTWDINTASRAYLFKLNDAHQLQWARILGTTYLSTKAMRATSDGGFALAEYTNAIVLVKTDAMGLPCPACGIDSGGVAITGIVLEDRVVTASDVGMLTDGTLTATTANMSRTVTCTSVGIDEPFGSEGTVRIAPQPVGSQARISFPEEWLAKGTLDFTLLDALGHVVASQRVRQMPFVFERGDLAPAVYSYALTLNGIPQATGLMVME